MSINQRMITAFDPKILEKEWKAANVKLRLHSDEADIAKKYAAVNSLALKAIAGLVLVATVVMIASYMNKPITLGMLCEIAISLLAIQTLIIIAENTRESVDPSVSARLRRAGGATNDAARSAWQSVSNFFGTEAGTSEESFIASDEAYASRQWCRTYLRDTFLYPLATTLIDVMQNPPREEDSRA